MKSLLNAAAMTFVLVSGTFVARADDGFKPLFNGKDLTGWVTPSDKSLFTVEDGAIVCRTKCTPNFNPFLATDKPYADFILKMKVKIRNHNSGIQFRSKRNDDGSMVGPQADVADGFWGLLYEERGRGILERYPEEKANALVKRGDWNEFVIEARGDHAIIHFNGVKIIDRVDPKFEPAGLIGLQVHVGPAMEVRFKDIEIKVLD